MKVCSTQGLQMQQEERLFKQNLKELEASRSFLAGKSFSTNIVTCFSCFRTLAEEKKKMYEEWMTEKRKRAAEEEVERRMERERLAGKAKEVEEEKKREKEVNAEKQARLARWEQSSTKMLNISSF